MDIHSEKNLNLKILSIDIGIINLGYVYSEGLNVLQCNRVNITKVKHNKVCYCNCKLHHDFCIPDYLDHFIQEHSNIFENSDIILIERQPPVGITNVQDLLFTKFRNKVKLVSPNTIHKFFKMTKGDYDTRKIESLQLTNEYLQEFTTFQNNERKHDISDAMLMIIYYLKINEKPLKKVKHVFDTYKFIPFDNFERFRFIKK
jgi:hypothetical protein